MERWYIRGNYQLTANGIYSVSSSYNAMLRTLIRLREAEVIWSAVMLPRQRLVMWLAYQDKLLTKERLQRLQIPVDGGSCCFLYDLDVL